MKVQDIALVGTLDLVREEYAARGMRVFPNYFVATAEFLSLAANASARTSVPIEGGSDFALLAMTASCYNETNATLALPDAIVEVIENVSGRGITDAPTHIGNLFGSGWRPFVLPVPLMLRAGTALGINLTNNSASKVMTFRLAFHGAKLYPQTAELARA